MKGIALESCEVGTVSSCKDGSVKFSVYTAELRPSERGVVMDYHGKACGVTIIPHEGTPEEVVTVTTERDSKTPSQRLRGILFLVWKHEGERTDFDTYYSQQLAKLCDHFKTKLPE